MVIMMYFKLGNIFEKYFTDNASATLASCISHFFTHGEYAEDEEIKNTHEILKTRFTEEDSKELIKCLFEIFVLHRYDYHQGDEFYEEMKRQNTVSREELHAKVERAITGR